MAVLFLDACMYLEVFKKGITGTGTLSGRETPPSTDAADRRETDGKPRGLVEELHFDGQFSSPAK